MSSRSSVPVKGNGSCPITELMSISAIKFDGLRFFAEGDADWSGTVQLWRIKLPGSDQNNIRILTNFVIQNILFRYLNF